MNPNAGLVEGSGSGWGAAPPASTQSSSGWGAPSSGGWTSSSSQSPNTNQWGSRQPQQPNGDVAEPVASASPKATLTSSWAQAVINSTAMGTHSGAGPNQNQVPGQHHNSTNSCAQNSGSHCDNSGILDKKTAESSACVKEPKVIEAATLSDNWGNAVSILPTAQHGRTRALLMMRIRVCYACALSASRTTQVINQDNVSCR